MVSVVVIGGILLVVGAYFLSRRQAGKRQQAYIDDYPFHPAIRSKLAAKHPQLTEGQLDLVFQGLRDYFHICNMAGAKRMVAMPSQVVDDAWHEFILFTRAYQQFCRHALGRYLHHTPAEAMAGPTTAQESIKRAWRLACAKEGLNPRGAYVLPLLFAIDSELNIPGGFVYVPDCRNPNSPNYNQGQCASHIGCAAGCSGDTGALRSDSSSGGVGDGFGGDGFGGDGCGGAGCSGGCGGD